MSTLIEVTLGIYTFFDVILCLCTCTGVRLSSLENRKACKQGTLKELFQRQASAESPTKLQTAVEQAIAQTDMATCPVCNQLVPAENTVFNQHIDECLNEETLSGDSVSAHQSNLDDSSFGSSSQALSPFKLQGSDSHCCPTQNSLCASNSPSTLAHSRKRKASVSTTHKAKRLTLDHYFNSTCRQKH